MKLLTSRAYAGNTWGSAPMQQTRRLPSLAVVRHRRAVTLIAAAIAALVLTACGSGEGTSSSCDDFLDKDESTQLDLAAKVASQNSRGAVSEEMGKAVARPYREKLIEYCQQSGHGGDQLKDLSLGLGP